MGQKDLRDMLDKIKLNVRALKTISIHENQVGPLLIPIVLKKLPNLIRLKVSGRLEKENWNIEDFMDCNYCAWKLWVFEKRSRTKKWR